MFDPIAVLWFFIILVVVVLLYKYVDKNTIFAAIVGGFTDSPVLKEYNRWSISQQRLKIISSLSHNHKQQYEAKNILERWYLSSENGADATEKMKEELIEKHLVNGARVNSIIKSLLSVKPNNITSGAKLNITLDGLITFADYARKISRDRINILRKMGSDDDILRSALRYSSMINGGQQWNIPFKVYEALITQYNVTVEGFASPFNSQLIKYDQRLHFCSLFPDVDHVFGSVGSFFDYDFVGKSATVNPPYVLDIMEKTAKKCADTMQTAESMSLPTRLFITVPDWTDAGFYQDLSRSKFLETSLNHPARTYYYEDSNNDDRQIIATFATTIFILSYGMTYESYETINDAFKL